MAILGIDVGGSFIKTGLLHEDTLQHTNAATIEKASFESFLLQLQRCFDTYQKLEPIEAVSIGIPGAVTYPGGVMTQSPHLPILNGVSLREELEDRWDIPVFVANDVNLAAYGEFRKNKHVSEDTHIFIYLSIGTGLGGGIILDGDIFWGAQGFAGEFGHISVENDGPECKCGSRGCLELYVSSTGILRITREILWKYADSRLKRFQIDRLHTTDIFEAARFGDKAAIEALEVSALAFGRGLANIMNIFNPDLIVVGGGVMGSNDFYLQRSIQLAQRYTFEEPYKHCNIQPATLKYYAGVWGASLYMTERWLPHLQGV